MVFVCLLRIEVKKNKADRCFVQTKRPCRSLFNFVPHSYVFSSIQAETTALLLHIYRLLFNLFTPFDADLCDSPISYAFLACYQ